MILYLCLKILTHFQGYQNCVLCCGQSLVSELPDDLVLAYAADSQINLRAVSIQSLQIYMRKVLKHIYLQGYRSGHNEAVLKTVWPKATRVRIPPPAPKET